MHGQYQIIKDVTADKLYNVAEVIYDDDGQIVQVTHPLGIAADSIEGLMEVLSDIRKEITAVPVLDADKMYEDYLYLDDSEFDEEIEDCVDFFNRNKR